MAILPNLKRLIIFQVTLLLLLGILFLIGPTKFIDSQELAMPELESRPRKDKEKLVIYPPIKHEFSVYDSGVIDLIPTVNVYWNKKLLKSDTTNFQLLYRQIPGYMHVYENRNLTFIWKSATTSAYKIPFNWVEEQIEYPFEREYIYFTHIIGSKEFYLKNKKHKFLSISTAQDEAEVGRLIGGRLGLLVAEWTDSTWKLVYFNPALGVYGQCQQADMPIFTQVGDSVVFIQNNNEKNYAGGPQTMSAEILVYQNAQVKSLGWINNYNFYKQFPGTVIGSKSTYIDSIASYRVVSRGEFCPHCDGDIYENPKRPEYIWQVYHYYGNKPFKFEWIREFKLVNNKWQYSDRGCRILQWLNAKKCCELLKK